MNLCVCVLLWKRPRQRLVLAAALDACGVLALAHTVSPSFPATQSIWIATAYLLFGWLFGSYTLLRWPWLRLRLVLLRILFPCVATLFSLIILDWALGLPSHSLLSQRDPQLFLFWALAGWSLLVRLILRYLLRWAPDQEWPLLADGNEARRVLLEWGRHPNLPARPPRLVSPSALLGGAIPISPAGIVLGRELRLLPDQENRLRLLQQEGLSITTVLQLAEDQLERLPPSLLPEEWLAMSDITWANSFSVQRQLKRAADVLFSILLLVGTAPLIFIAAVAIWLEDRGPVFYRQKRSGLMGQPFVLLKLRTMKLDRSRSSELHLTRPRDPRITRVGVVLRRFRIDELPQLIHVLSGDMSLIGPRPEQPELEARLEQLIPHYRKRHWMRPGLSGWAQVCAPYAASLDEAELKLGYDLYYLRHWSIAFDILILFKTVKTILQAGGR